MIQTSMPQGRIFDVHRFSLNDGPGIRSTIFLKGCPLSCQWCHNPESISFKQELSFDLASCTDCGHCVDTCNEGVFKIENGKLQINRSSCTFCENCISTCPENALKIIGYQSDIAPLVQTMLRDKAYYDESDGGVTVSGGEPMSQFEFTLTLLKALKKEKLHTCLDTSGLAPWHRYEKVLPYVNTFLYDYKATGTNLHRNLTGVPSKRITDNLNALIKKGAEIILRCPMIPTVNDSETHLHAIAQLDKNYPQLRGIELMAYHRMGNEKGIRAGLIPPIEMPDANNEIKDRWLHTLRQAGCNKAIIG